MSKRKNKLVPFETIVLATQGDPQALEQVIRHYRPYILSLCRREYIAENGNVSIVCDNQPFKLPKPHLPFTLSLIIARVIRSVNTILLRYETTTDNTDLLQGWTLFARPACWFVIYHFLCIPTTGYWYLGSIVP